MLALRRRGAVPERSTALVDTVLASALWEALMDAVDLEDPCWLYVGDRWCHLSGAFVMRSGQRFKAGYCFTGIIPGQGMGHSTQRAAREFGLKHAEAQK